jgi:hypothetical protein
MCRAESREEADQDRAERYDGGRAHPTAARAIPLCDRQVQLWSAIVDLGGCVC